MNLKTKAKGSLQEEGEVPISQHRRQTQHAHGLQKMRKVERQRLPILYRLSQRAQGQKREKTFDSCRQGSAVGIAQSSSSIRDGVLRVLGNESSEADRPR